MSLWKPLSPSTQKSFQTPREETEAPNLNQVIKISFANILNLQAKYTFENSKEIFGTKMQQGGVDRQ